MTNDKYVINLGRQLGSGGKEIAVKLATELGINCFDKELLTLAAQESGLCQEFFEKADEHTTQNIIGGIFGTRFPFYSDGVAPIGNCLSNESLFKIQSDVIHHIAEKESALFVGRCADYVLRDHPRCVNLFISAPEEIRCKRIMETKNVSKEVALEMIDKGDRKRAAYYNYFSYKTWGAAASYHLCIDSSVLGIDGTVEYLKEFVKLKIGI